MKFTPATDILNLAQEQREQLARELFDYEAISERITKEATKGFNGLRITQDVPINLRETKAAQSLVEKLTGSGFTCKWMEATHREVFNGRETASFLVFAELTISWGDVERRGGVLTEV